MKHAFSLVELAIVLVILGLLVGGVLTGQSLIRASEIRNVLTESQRYETAVHSFRDRFLGLPGDIRNAEGFWGTAAACPGTNATPATGTATCNGDGDGSIGSASNRIERYRFWQQLANAGLIEGSFTGVPVTTATNTIQAAVNIPSLRLNNAGIGVADSLSVAASPAFWTAGLSPHLLMVYDGSLATLGTAPGILAPEEAWSIDIKADDGRPGLGAIRAVNTNSATTPNCVTTANSSTAEYDLTLNSLECSLVLDAGF